MASSQSGPVPSKLTLLSDLDTHPPGSKVRFLGCVTNYSTKTATLTLEHNHPAYKNLKAIVDIGLLVSTLGSNETRIGEWVNVIGYVKMDQTAGRPNDGCLRCDIQAIVLWPSGPFHLQAYERSLDQQKVAEGAS